MEFSDFMLYNMDVQLPLYGQLESHQSDSGNGQARCQNPPYIVLFANVFDEDMQRSMQARLNPHLSKPVQPDVLYETPESLIMVCRYYKMMEA